MPVKTSFVTEQHIRDTALPTYGKTYAVIPHGYVIDTTRLELENAGLEIERELYKTTQDGQIAQGIYHLTHREDPEMGLMFAWSNSYNKQMRFKCAIGGYVFVCMNGVVSGNMGNYHRKHTGSAKFEAFQSIKNQIADAKMFYQGLIADKEMLKHVTLSKAEQASLVGRLFLEQEILTLTQLGQIEREMKKPSFVYSQNPQSAWDLYNHVTFSLKDSHPMKYLSDHQKVHNFFVDQFGTIQTNKAPLAQLEMDFYEPIEDEEVEEVVYPDVVTEPELEPELEPNFSGYGVSFL